MRPNRPEYPTRASDQKANEVERRWEQGIPHDPRSIELAEALARIDYEQGSDFFCLKFGGDGDNGEELAYLLDIYFAARPGESE